MQPLREAGARGGAISSFMHGGSLRYAIGNVKMPVARLRSARRNVVLSGAGMSAQSGIPGRQRARRPSCARPPVAHARR